MAGGQADKRVERLNPIVTIEPEHVRAVREDDDWEEVEDKSLEEYLQEVPPEGVVVEVEIEEEPHVETNKWVNEATNYAKEFAEREKKYLAEKGVVEVYKELLKIATLDELVLA